VNPNLILELNQDLFLLNLHFKEKILFYNMKNKL
jgi:hypothetical protein